MLTKLLNSKLFIDKRFSTKDEALKYFVDTLFKNGIINDKKVALEATKKRENEFPTNIGQKIAMPHILSDAVNEPTILFAKVHNLVWDRKDKTENGKVDYVFYLLYNKTAKENLHMDTIQELSTLLLDETFVSGLKQVNSTDELIDLINNNVHSNSARTWISQRNKKSKVTATKASNISPSSSKKSNSGYDIVAVTACPTGIAHTFLAKDSLEKEAKKRGLTIKVETQGTEGVRNSLTEQDISNAKGIILALDRSIDTTKFSGYDNIIEISTNDAIKNAAKQFDKVMNNEGVKFQGTKSNSTGQIEDTNLMSFNKFGKRIYKSLMNGVGHMLPFVIFGGILIAIAFMIDAFSFSKEYIEAHRSDFGTLTDASAWFKQVGGLAFNLMIPILAGYMAFGLVGKVGLLPGFVVGLMSTGFLNKEGIPWLMDFLSPKQLGMMSNGSGFFGAIGGALLSAVIIILLSKYVFNRLPKSLDAIKNILFMPLISTFIIVGLFFLINIPLQFVNLGFAMMLDAFANKPELYPLLGIIMGLMMCADLGGPINKAAYVFGTITLSSAGSSGSIPMAIAMGAGMVPPIAIALSTSINRSIWTYDQRKQGLTNYIMGASFISEGAIPFTAEQPKKMIIANLVGGAITGIIIGSLQVSSLAPHGGVFVLPLIRCNLDVASTEGLKIGLGITFFLGAIIIGSIIEMLIIYFISKTKWGANTQLAEEAH